MKEFKLRARGGPDRGDAPFQGKNGYGGAIKHDLYKLAVDLGLAHRTSYSGEQLADVAASLAKKSTSHLFQ